MAAEMDIYEHTETETFDSAEEAEDRREYLERVGGVLCRLREVGE